MKKALLITGIILLLNAIFLVFAVNFHIGIALQFSMGIMVILYAVFFKKIKKRVHITAAALCALLALFMGSLAIYGNINTANYTEDALIVLGAGIRGETVSPKLEKRLEKAVFYHSKNPRAVIVLCGGQGPQEDITESLAMERYLIEKGVPKGIIIREEQSTSTFENFTNAKKLLDEHFKSEYTTAFITSDYHVFRAAKTAKYAGFSATHIGASAEWYAAFANYLREMPAAIKLWLFSPA